MELKIIGRGALAGGLSGLLAFVFARLFCEPLVDRAIDYESGRDDILNKINEALGQASTPDGPEIFSRTIQSTVGIATGIIGIGIAFGMLMAVAYLLLHGRFGVRPRTLAWMIGGLGFLGIYLLPFAKYPANPPAIGHDFTIEQRGQLYLVTVVAALAILGGAVFAARRMVPRLGTFRAVLLAALGALVLYGVVMALLPSLGNLPANVDAQSQFGYAKALTETPQPITNIAKKTLTIDGMTYAPGQMIYPGFDADLLWKFRWYSILNQLIIWAGTSLVLGWLVERLLAPASARRTARIRTDETVVAAAR